LPLPPQVEQVEPALPQRRPVYPLVALALLGLLGGGAYWAWPLLSAGRVTPPPAEVEREPLRQARELLRPSPPTATAVEDALRLLRQERESYNTPEVHRLLSRAYEAQNNRLRALGHLYVAVQLGGGAADVARSQLALAELLSRLGHVTPACQTLHKAKAALGEPALRRQAETLAGTLHCAK
jgi:tetratricopeptide (TPR) repeat protein